LAALKLADAYPANEPAGKQFKRAVGVFPKPKENNGVCHPARKWQRCRCKVRNQGTVDSPDGLLFTCTINTSRGVGNAESRAVVFAGENIANLRNPLPEGLDAGIYDLENRAWDDNYAGRRGQQAEDDDSAGAYLVWKLDLAASRGQQECERSD